MVAGIPTLENSCAEDLDYCWLTDESEMVIVPSSNHPEFADSPGLALVIDNRKFAAGPAMDVVQLLDAFKLFSICSLFLDNPSVKEIQDVVQRVKSLNFTGRSCFIMVILTNEGQYDVLSAKDGYYSLSKTILSELDEHLKAVPKYMFTQADIKLHKERKSSNVTEGIPDEFLRLDSSFDGSMDSGSYFLKSVCNVLTNHGTTKSLREVIRLIKVDYKENAVQGLHMPSVNNDTMTVDIILGDYAKRNRGKCWTSNVNLFFKKCKSKSGCI